MGPGVVRVGKEGRSQANMLGDKVMESMQASEDGKGKGRLSISSCGTSRDIIPWTQSSQFSLLGSPGIVMTGIHHVFQVGRNSFLQRKGDCHFFCKGKETVTSMSSQRLLLILWDVAKVKEDGFGSNAYDNRAPDKISTECCYR